MVFQLLSHAVQSNARSLCAGESNLQYAPVIFIHVTCKCGLANPEGVHGCRILPTNRPQRKDCLDRTMPEKALKARGGGKSRRAVCGWDSFKPNSRKLWGHGTLGFKPLGSTIDFRLAQHQNFSTNTILSLICSSRS